MAAVPPQKEATANAQKEAAQRQAEEEEKEKVAAGPMAGDELKARGAGRNKVD